MEFFPPGKVLNIMKYRKPVMTVSLVMVLASIVSLFVPGPRLGTDFSGGTELELQFRGALSSSDVREALARDGHAADVIAVQGKPNRYIVRLAEISTLADADKARIKTAFVAAMQAAQVSVQRFEVSEGGDKIAVRVTGSTSAEALRAALLATGAKVTAVHAVGGASEGRFEAQLEGLGEEVVEQLQASLGEKAPEGALRVEWVGPRAGRQLRDAAAAAIGYAILFIMLYIAFRFDLRFAPGAIFALAHDVLITLGVYVLFQREMALTTVAACLTILGYSVNDTIVVYDRIRENIGRERGKSFSEIVDISTSQVLSRSIITSGTTIVSVVPFLYFGTPTVKDIALAFVVGMSVGTYSSIYIASPITEWFDRNVFRRGPKTAA